MFESVYVHLMNITLSFWHVWVLSAPWLALGFVMSAVMKAFLGDDVLSRHLGGGGLWDVTKAALIGAPLPLCSCGVVPAALGLRASGASKNTTVSFLIATPETGVDSVPLTYGLMGPVMAVIRPVAAVCSAIVSGLLVGADKPQVTHEHSDACCETTIKQSNSCCGTEEAIQPSHWEKIKTGLSFAFGKLLDDVAVWLVIGLLVAAFVQVYLPAGFFESLGDGLLPMVVMALIGVPMYVCATASTPMAAGFLSLGLSPGAVLVFMLLGPASNIGTLMIIKNELGVRAIVGYLLGSVAVAFAFGLGLNFATSYFSWEWRQAVAVLGHEHVSIWGQIIATLMGLFVIKTLFQKIKQKIKPKPTECCSD